MSSVADQMERGRAASERSNPASWAVEMGRDGRAGLYAARQCLLNVEARAESGRSNHADPRRSPLLPILRLCIALHPRLLPLFVPVFHRNTFLLSSVIVDQAALDTLSLRRSPPGTGQDDTSAHLDRYITEHRP